MQLAHRGGWVYFIIPSVLFGVDRFWTSALVGAVLAAIAVFVSWTLARRTLNDARQLKTYTEWHPQLMGPFVYELSALETAGLSPIAHEAQWRQIYNRLAEFNVSDEK